MLSTIVLDALTCSLMERSHHIMKVYTLLMVLSEFWEKGKQFNIISKNIRKVLN